MHGMILCKLVTVPLALYTAHYLTYTCIIPYSQKFLLDKVQSTYPCITKIFRGIIFTHAVKTDHHRLHTVKSGVLL